MAAHENLQQEPQKKLKLRTKCLTIIAVLCVVYLGFYINKPMMFTMDERLEEFNINLTQNLSFRLTTQRTYFGYSDIPILSPFNRDFGFISKRNHTSFVNDQIFSSITRSSPDTGCITARNISSGLYSILHDVKVATNAGVVTFIITTYDAGNRKKTYGGDVIMVHAVKMNSNEHAVKGKEPDAVAGEVMDNENGTYTVTIKMLWSGDTRITAKIISKYENQCRRYRAMSLYGDSVYAMPNPHNTWFTFKHGGHVEKTRCSPFPSIHGYTSTCNFTKENFGLSYFCGHPPTLDCRHATLVSFTKDYTPTMSGNDLVLMPLMEDLHQQIDLQFNNSHDRTNVSYLLPCSERPPMESWLDPLPSGGGYDGGWLMGHCKHEQLRTDAKIRACLAGKRIFVQGDSTVRQYFETLTKWANTTDRIEKRRNYLEFRSEKHNIDMSWHIHELPYHCGGCVGTCIADDSVAGRILDVAMDIRNTTDGLNSTSGSDIVYLITYNTHLQSYHSDVFRNRVKSLVKPIQVLLEHKPKAKVIFKGPHLCTAATKWFDGRNALIYREILFEELKPVLSQVIYLDTLSIAASHGNTQLHPTGPTLTAQLDQFLAYIC